MRREDMYQYETHTQQYEDTHIVVFTARYRVVRGHEI
jgi:hypothetical protein